MRHLLIKSLSGAGLFLMSLTASGQSYPRPDYRYTTPRDEREMREHNRLFERAQVDLDRASTNSPRFSVDRARVARAREEVSECQRLVASGEYDRHQFDEAIVAVQRVADLNRLSDRNRDYLRDDVRELRELQLQLEG